MLHFQYTTHIRGVHVRRRVSSNPNIPLKPVLTSSYRKWRHRERTTRRHENGFTLWFVSHKMTKLDITKDVWKAISRVRWHIQSSFTDSLNTHTDQNDFLNRLQSNLIARLYTTRALKCLSYNKVKKYCSIQTVQLGNIPKMWYIRPFTVLTLWQYTISLNIFAPALLKGFLSSQF